MADVVTLKPRHEFWLRMTQMFAPTVDKAMIATVTAGLTLGGTWAHGKITTAPAASKIAAPAIPADLVDRLTKIEGSASLCVDEIQQLRLDFKPRPPQPIMKAAPAKPAK